MKNADEAIFNLHRRLLSVGKIIERLTLLADTQYIAEIKDLKKEFKALKSEIKVYQKSLNKQNKLLEKLEHLAHIGNWEWLMSEGKLTCSKEVFNIFGSNSLNKGSVISLDFYFRFIHPDDRDMIEKILKDVFINPKNFQLRHRMLLRNGDTKYVEVLGEYRYQHESDIKFVGTIQDISQITRAHEKLLAVNRDLHFKMRERTSTLDIALSKERYLKEIIQTSENIILSLDQNAKILSFNPMALRFFCKEEYEIYGKTIIEMPISKKEEIGNLLQEVLTSKLAHSIECELLTDDLTDTTLLLNISPVFDGVNKLVGLSVIGKDITELKKLQLTEKIQNTMFETMNEGVLIVNNEDDVVFANEFFCQMMEYQKSEIIGRKAFDLFLDEETINEMNSQIALRKIGESSRYEIELRKKSGKKLWVLVSGSPIFDLEGNISGSMGIHTDISHRKQMQAELNAIADISKEDPNPVFRFSIETQRLLYSNPASKSALLYFQDPENKETRAIWLQVINDVYRSGNSIRKELQMGKQSFMCTITPIPERAYVNIYAVEITAVKEAEFEIRKLSLALAKTENSVMLTDKAGIIQWVNEGFENLTGFTALEVIGTQGEIMRKVSSVRVRHGNIYLEKINRHKDSISFESRKYKRNGEEFWAITTLTPLLGENGEIESIIAIDTNITEKKMAEKEMLKAKKIAEDSARSKELFLANMSHEIRTPMNAIMGIVQLLKKTKLTEEQLDYLESMDFSGKHLLNIINDILDLTKIESGKMRLENINFSLKTLLVNLYNSIGYTAQEKGIKFFMEMSPDMFDCIVGDPVRLNQILMNLLSNAIKFTAEGYIKLKVFAIKENAKLIQLRFVIEDSGIGIKKAMQKLIFEEFEQANKEITRQYGGTGLGLSIVKKLINAMKGSIAVDSYIGRGTIFTVDLEFNKGNLNSIGTGDEALLDSINLKDIKILLVEDNKLNQMVATRFLESSGSVVTVANNGQDCINLLSRGEKYNIILMDLQMPILDGYSTAVYIRNELGINARQLPILAMTAHALQGEKEKCLVAGMNDYIAKPLKKEALDLKIFHLIKQ